MDAHAYLMIGRGDKLQVADNRTMLIDKRFGTSLGLAQGFLVFSAYSLLKRAGSRISSSTLKPLFNEFILEGSGKK